MAAMTHPINRISSTPPNPMALGSSMPTGTFPVALPFGSATCNGADDVLDRILFAIDHLNNLREHMRAECRKHAEVCELRDRALRHRGRTNVCVVAELRAIHQKYDLQPPIVRQKWSARVMVMEMVLLQSMGA